MNTPGCIPSNRALSAEEMGKLAAMAKGAPLLKPTRASR